MSEPSAERYAAVIRHVGIARTVLDRFEELARGPSTAEQLGTALGRIGAQSYDRDADEQLRVGEASQIFPEVWINLDAAGRTLAALGEPCSGIPAPNADNRLAFRVGHAGVDGFNLESARAARAAIRAIEAATPAIDWAGIVAADAAFAADAYRQLGGRSRKAIGIIGVVIMIVVLLCFVAIKVIGNS